MSLSTSILLRCKAAESAAADLVTASGEHSIVKQYDLTSGVAANQADRVFSDTRTLAASATENLDLAGALTGLFGSTVTIVKLKAVIIKAAAGNTNNVNVSRPASNGVPLFSAAGDEIPVLPDGAFIWVAPGAGITVTAGTGDLLTITNSAGGTPVTYDVMLIGTSA